MKKTKILAYTRNKVKFLFKDLKEKKGHINWTKYFGHEPKFTLNQFQYFYAKKIGFENWYDLINSKIDISTEINLYLRFCSFFNDYLKEDDYEFINIIGNEKEGFSNWKEMAKGKIKRNIKNSKDYVIKSLAYDK